MYSIFIILLITALSHSYGIKRNTKTIFSSSKDSSINEPHYQLFSTSTAYDRVRGDINKQSKCKPKAIWAFVRHGTRYPHTKEMDRYRALESIRDSILSNHVIKKGSLKKFQLNLLRNWKFNVTNEQEMHLTTSGYEELIKLGERMKKRFPDILNRDKLNEIKMMRTSADRTTESGAAFAQGMFGIPIVLPNHTVDDELLKNGKKCKLWKVTTKSPELKKYIEQFKNSSEIETLVANVNKRLGFDISLSFDTVKDIYDMCGFETSWYHGAYSPWCAAFSTSELQLMEYLEDLTYYWKSGFGNNYTKKLGCELVHDIITKLENYKNTSRVHLYFAHSLGIREILVSLGIGKCEVDLPGSKYLSPNDRDNCWRTSHLMPFSANIISVLYKCKSKGEDRLKIGVYVNEKIIQLPFCNGKDLCDFEAFKNNYGSLIHPSYCNRDFCSLSSSHRSIVACDDDDDYDDYEDY